MSEITRILSAIDDGDQHAAEQLMPLVYSELRKLAAQRLAQEKPGQTLQATALVHEVYLRLIDQTERPEGGGGFSGRSHFFAAAAEAMRRILVERARRRQRVKHGAGRAKLDVNQELIAAPEVPEDILALDHALDRLAATNMQAATLVKLRFFAGLTNEQSAGALGISPRKANQIWAYARAWLREEIDSSAG